jgi:hypothetical protein
MGMNMSTERNEELQKVTAQDLDTACLLEIHKSDFEVVTPQTRGKGRRQAPRKLYKPGEATTPSPKQKKTVEPAEEEEDDEATESDEEEETATANGEGDTGAKDKKGKKGAKGKKGEKGKKRAKGRSDKRKAGALGSKDEQSNAKKRVRQAKYYKGKMERKALENQGGANQQTGDAFIAYAVRRQQMTMENDMLELEATQAELRQRIRNANSQTPGE